MSPLTLALGFAIGYAAHRASLCNVRAVAELLERKPPRLLASFLQAAAWTTLAGGVLMLAMLGMPHPALQREPLALAMAGAAVFGVGAALNGGCALSTVQRLVDGEAAMLGTLAGFTLGLVSWWRLLAGALPGAGLTALPMAFDAGMPWKRGVIVVLGAWGAWQLWRLARDGGSPWQRLRAPAWMPASAALVLGLAGGLLGNLQGGWTWTATLGRVIEARSGHGMPPEAAAFAVLLALLAGMVVSSWQRGAFAWRRPQGAVLTRSLVAGGLMGLGAGALPGGNDAVVLVTLPTLAPQALAVYAAMLVGIAAVLAWARRSRL